MFKDPGYFPIYNILPANEKLLGEGLFLVLVNCQNTPPHILLSIHGNTFSLSSTGVDMDSDLKALLHLVKRKSIPTIFFTLHVPSVSSWQFLTKIIQKVFSPYERIEPGQITCLTPIKGFCRALYRIPVSAVDFVFELLPVLAENRYLGNCYHFNLDKQMKNGTFYLKKYGMDEVTEFIRMSKIKLN